MSATIKKEQGQTMTMLLVLPYHVEAKTFFKCRCGKVVQPGERCVFNTIIDEHECEQCGSVTLKECR